MTVEQMSFTNFAHGNGKNSNRKISWRSADIR